MNQALVAVRDDVGVCLNLLGKVKIHGDIWQLGRRRHAHISWSSWGAPICHMHEIPCCYPNKGVDQTVKMHELESSLKPFVLLRNCSGRGYIKQIAYWIKLYLKNKKNPNLFSLQLLLLPWKSLQVLWHLYKSSWFSHLFTGNNWHWLLIENHVLGGSNSE